MNYSMLTYLPKERKFITKNKQRIEPFRKKDSEEIINSFREQVDHFARVNKARVLQDSFNIAIEGNKEHYNKCIEKIITKLNSEVYNRLAEIGAVEQNGAKITLKMNEIKKSTEEYQNAVRVIANDVLNGTKKEDDLDTTLYRLNSSLNKLRGDIFENFLALVFDHIYSEFQGVIDFEKQDITKDIANIIENTLSSVNNGMTFNVSYQGEKAGVAGSKITSSVEVSVNKNKLSIRGSQQKSDIEVEDLEGPFGISAKSYSGMSRPIKLSSKSNVAALITLWPSTDELTKNRAMNTLSVPTLRPPYLNAMKKIFLIQALMGSREDEIKSQFLVINTHRQNNPILVFSVYDLLFEQQIKPGKGGVTGTSEFNDLLNQIPRSKEGFFKFVQSATISIKTNLTISGLEALYKQT